MLLSRTETQPAHYTLEINGFSVLSEDPTIKIKSDVFEARGYNWRLDLIPNRHDEVNAANNVSLYLILCGTTKESEFDVHVKFFLYDHIRRNYVIFQDVDGKRATFQRKWGFDKLISLEQFKECSNGYLFNDSCVFGVEVLAAPKHTPKERCLSMIKPPTTMNTYTWTIDNFPTITQRYITSEVFKVGNVKWTLSLFPKGVGVGPPTVDLAIRLNLHKPDLLPKCWKVYAKFELRLKNQSGNDDRVEEPVQYWFHRGESFCNFFDFMKSSELRDTSKGFLLNNTLIAEVKISAVGMLKNNF